MSSIIQNPHDRFFRASMSNPRVASEFIQAHIPLHIAVKLDKDSLRLMPGNFIEDLYEWKTDLVFKATFQGDPGYIHLLIEHQRKSDPFMPLRLLEYSQALSRVKCNRREQDRNRKGYMKLIISKVRTKGDYYGQRLSSCNPRYTISNLCIQGKRMVNEKNGRATWL